jgi:hypothetical protein
MEPLRNLPKHERYGAAYKRFGWFWGLGVEHETYLISSQTRKITTFDAATMKPERYSVNYYKNYKEEPLQLALADAVSAAGGSMIIPVLLNCHSLTNCDVFGEHATTYERQPKPNPKYTGTPMFDWACQHSPWLRAQMGKVFMWDGDTVEFMTQNFYCATVDSVMRELEEGERQFEKEMAHLPKTGVLVAYGPLRLASPKNEPWATHLTNPRAVSMFNNGTFHINVTLPTRLNWNYRPLRQAKFRQQHQRLARLIQWLEPLWIAVYGSGDPFVTASPTHGAQFAAGSQRLAVSRYIGLGTFDTDTMPVGKILQIPKVAGAYPWYDWLHARTAYAPLDIVGLDLNYSKHGAHGLELRFLDQMPFGSLRAIMEQVVVLCDVAVEQGWDIPKPQESHQWILGAGASLYEGAGWRVVPEFMNAVCRALRIPSGCKEPMWASQALTWVFQRLEPRKAYCWRVMMGDQPVGCRPL